MSIVLAFEYSHPPTRASVRVTAFKVHYHEDADGMLRSSDGAVFGWVDRQRGIVVRTMVHPSIRYQLKRKGRPGWKHIKASR